MLGWGDTGILRYLLLAIMNTLESNFTISRKRRCSYTEIQHLMIFSIVRCYYTKPYQFLLCCLSSAHSFMGACLL